MMGRGRRHCVPKMLERKPFMSVSWGCLSLQAACLAASLGFASPQITELQKYPSPAPTNLITTHSRPLLVTTGSGEKKKWRCGTPTKRAYEKDGQFLVVGLLHSETEEEGEGITSFFVRKSMYLAFMGRPDPHSH